MLKYKCSSCYPSLYLSQMSQLCIKLLGRGAAKPKLETSSWVWGLSVFSLCRREDQPGCWATGQWRFDPIRCWNKRLLIEGKVRRCCIFTQSWLITLIWYKSNQQIHRVTNSERMEDLKMKGKYADKHTDLWWVILQPSFQPCSVSSCSNKTESRLLQS